MIECFVCYDITNNRPRHTQCACGKSYAPEGIGFDLDARGASSLASYSELHGEPDGGGHPAGLSPRTSMWCPQEFEAMT